jgi:hypothetical protein
MTDTIMAYVGVDWASATHYAYALDATGQKLDHRSFPHSGEGLADLVGWIRTTSGHEPSHIAVGIEVPHGPVVESLMDAGFLGYSPNPHARSLRMARTGSLAMILPEINSPAFAAMIQGAQKAAHERGYSMLLGGVGPDGDDPELPARLLQKNRVDGFLVSSGLREAESLAALRSLDAPAVLLNRYLDEVQPHAVLDDEGGVAALVRHLIGLGHRRIGFLGSPKRFLGMRRVAGYRIALEEAAIAFDAALVSDAGYTREGGERAMEALLSFAPAANRGVRNQPLGRGRCIGRGRAQGVGCAS